MNFVDPEQKKRTIGVATAAYFLTGLLYKCAKQECSSIEIMLQNTEPKMEIRGTKDDQQTALDSEIDSSYIEYALSSIYRIEVQKLRKKDTAKAIHLASAEKGVKEPFSTELNLTRDSKSRCYRIEFKYERSS